MAIEYKKNEDGSFSVWNSGQQKIQKDTLTFQKSQISENLAALDSVAALTKEEALIVSQIVRQQEELIKNPSFTWAEIIAKFKVPLEEQKTAIETALATVVEPK